MNKTVYSLLYVADVDKSAAFYAELLGLSPIELSPTFALFRVNEGLMLGLWLAGTVKPAADEPGGSEICLTVDALDAANATFAGWKAKGFKVLQEPTDMDFGYTFVVADPDGHRVRVFKRADNPV